MSIIHGDRKWQAAINSLQAKIDQLEAENRSLKAKLSEPTGVPYGSRQCPSSLASFPDSFAFFGASADDPDQSKCAACSRAARHADGLQHFSNGCPLCQPQ